MVRESLSTASLSCVWAGRTGDNKPCQPSGGLIRAFVVKIVKMVVPSRT